MEENIKQRRHHASFVKVSHSECKAGMGEKDWQKYHTIEKDKPETYNVSDTLSDEKQPNVHERRESKLQDSLYVIMSSCEQAMQSSVQGNLASHTYSTGLENDNVAQRRMQEKRDNERDHQLKSKVEYTGKYMPYLVMQTQEKGVDRESDVEHNSYSKAFIKLPYLSIREDGRKGQHNLHNKRGNLNKRDLRPNSITEKPLLNQQRLSVGKPVRDYTHVLNNKWVALPPPLSSGRIVGAFGSNLVPKLQNSTTLNRSLFSARDKVHISRHTNLTDESLSSEDDNCIEKQAANKITTVAVQSGYMKESATDAKINKESSRCDTYTVLTRDKKEHEDLHPYTQLQHESATDAKINKEPSRCDTYTVLTHDKKEHEDVHQYTQLQHASNAVRPHPPPPVPLSKRNNGSALKEHDKNSLFYGIGSSFAVTLITTDVSSKCDFIEHQDYTLTVDRTKLYLSDKRTQGILCDWPYTAIRRISADHSKHLFQFEAGRKCSSGPGSLHFYAAESRILYNSTMQAMTGAHKKRCKSVQ